MKRKCEVKIDDFADGQGLNIGEVLQLMGASKRMLRNLKQKESLFPNFLGRTVKFTHTET